VSHGPSPLSILANRVPVGYHDPMTRPLLPPALTPAQTQRLLEYGWGKSEGEGDPAIPGRFRSALGVAVMGRAAGSSPEGEDGPEVAAAPDLDLIDALLSAGCPVNWQDPHGMHSLFFVPHAHLPIVLPHLVRAGIDVDQPNKRGMTVLADMATPGNHFREPHVWLGAVRALLEAGADPWLDPTGEDESFMGWVEDGHFRPWLREGVHQILAELDRARIDKALPDETTAIVRGRL
jgi:hypothetical protein